MKFVQILSRVIIVVLTPILACFGFTACGNDDDEYGSPYATLSLSGYVQTTDEIPIEGIEVTVEETGGPTISNVNGRWWYHGSVSEYSNLHPDYVHVALHAFDPDGAENGGCFADTEKDIVVEQVHAGENDWDYGTFVEYNVKIQMEEIECPDAGVDDDGGIDGGTNSD